MKGRALVWVAAALAVGGIAGLSAYLAVAGLDRASAAAGVVAAVVELVAMVVGVYGIVRERRAARGGQVVSGASVFGSVTQIRAVRGSVNIRHGATQPGTAHAASVAANTGAPAQGWEIRTSSRGSGPTPEFGTHEKEGHELAARVRRLTRTRQASKPAPDSAGGQYVSDVQIGGNTTQIDGVDGDVTLE